MKRLRKASRATRQKAASVVSFDTGLPPVEFTGAIFDTSRLDPSAYRRQFLPTLSDLVDRLSIVQMKTIFIPDHAEEYIAERAAIEHDIDLILAGKAVTAADIHAILVIMLANRFIWENESKARQGGHENDHLLRLTHSINGVRNAAKNKLARLDGGRKDYKLDALAADLPTEFGNWSRIFEVDAKL